MDGVATAWIWGAPARFAGLLWLHPRRDCFAAGWRFARSWQRTWLALGLVGAHQAWWQVRQARVNFHWPEDFSPPLAADLIIPAAVAAADSVAKTLILPMAPEPFSALLALGLFINWGGLTGAFWRGCRAAFPRWGKWVGGALLFSAVANVAAISLEVGGEPDARWSNGLTIAGALWTGCAAAFALAWLVRFAETALRQPEEMLLIQWSGSAAGRILRLWPIVLAVTAFTLFQPIFDHLAPAWQWAMRTAAWALALSFAALPLPLVHWRGEWGWRPVFAENWRRLAALWPALLAWALVAFTLFFLFHLARMGISAGLPDGNVWQLAWESLGALLHAAILTWMLSAWIYHQPPIRPAE